MSSRYDVCTGRRYTNSAGEEKTAWTRIGTMFDKDGRKSIKLDALPLPNEKGDVWLSLFEQRDPGEKAEKPAGGGSRRPAPGPIDDDIPF